MKKRGAPLGQHFLTGDWAAKKLVAAVDARSNETIVEVGPGKGALTRELLQTGRFVIAIEKDEALVAQLHEIFRAEIGKGQLTIISGDVRDFKPNDERYVVAANIPYYITGEIIRQFLTASHPPRAMALLVQKEVAERILARDKKESILSISVKIFGTPSIVAKVSRGNFSPPPSVDSAIILISDIVNPFPNKMNEKKFFDVVRAGFASKRKFLANNLAVLFGKERSLAAITRAHLSEKTRAEDITVADWRDLAQTLT